MFTVFILATVAGGWFFAVYEPGETIKEARAATDIRFSPSYFPLPADPPVPPNSCMGATEAPRVYSDDGVPYLECDRTKYDWYGGYNFNIPPNIPITGIKVELKDVYGESGKDVNVRIRLSWDNRVSWTSGIDHEVIAKTQPGETIEFGDVREDWGHVWTADEINNNFWVQFEVLDQGDAGRAYLDWIPVTVRYGSSTSGFAWSENIGWISFNCLGDPADGCWTNQYGVDIDNYTGEFSGFAWSSNIGWIAFERAKACQDDTRTTCDVLADCIAAGLSGPCADHDPPDYDFNTNCDAGLICDASNNCIACYSSIDENVYGWAKIVSMGDDGWIKLRKNPAEAGSDYGVSIPAALGGEFTGWAWSGSDTASTSIGWISFSHRNCNTDGLDGDSDGGPGCPPEGTPIPVYYVFQETIPSDEPVSLAAAELTCSTVLASWVDNSIIESSFELYASSTISGGWVEKCSEPAEPGIGSLVSCVAAVDDGVPGDYRVRACNIAGCSDWEPDPVGLSFTTELCAPDNISSSTISCISDLGFWLIDINWDNPSATNDGYEIWRDDLDGNGMEFFTIITPANNRSVSDLIIVNETWNYRIRSFNQYVAPSTWSPDASGFTVTAGAYCSPKDLIAVSITCECIDLVWDIKGDEGSITRYDIFRDTLDSPLSGDIIDELIGSTIPPDKTFSDCNIVSDTGAYVYTVIAQDAGAKSADLVITNPCPTLPVWWEVAF